MKGITDADGVPLRVGDVVRQHRVYDRDGGALQCNAGQLGIVRALYHRRVGVDFRRTRFNNFTRTDEPVVDRVAAHHLTRIDWSDMSDWIDRDPEAMTHLRAASMILDQQARLNDMRAREGALARSLLEWRDLADKHRGHEARTVRVHIEPVRLALAALVVECDRADTSESLADWLDDRVAAADLARSVAEDGPEVWVDSRSAQRAQAVLWRLVEQGRVDDVEVAQLAAADLAGAPPDLDDAEHDEGTGPVDLVIRYTDPDERDKRAFANALTRDRAYPTGSSNRFNDLACARDSAVTLLTTMGARADVVERARTMGVNETLLDAAVTDTGMSLSLSVFEVTE
jgi:hypothetical protein